MVTTLQILKMSLVGMQHVSFTFKCTVQCSYDPAFHVLNLIISIHILFTNFTDFSIMISDNIIQNALRELKIKVW